jgi:hypothetical protein
MVGGSVNLVLGCAVKLPTDERKSYYSACAVCSAMFRNTFPHVIPDQIPASGKFPESITLCNNSTFRHT